MKILFMCLFFYLSGQAQSLSAETTLNNVRYGVVSVNANPNSRYLIKRPIEALRDAGALTPVLEKILLRIRNYGQTDFGIDALLFAEEPSKYSTFLPAERKEFSKLWQLLEIESKLDLSSPSVFTRLSELAPIIRPSPLRLNEDQRVDILNLPIAIQETAWRIVKSPGAPEGTISFNEVLNAIENYKIYTPTEYFHFDAVLRFIEADLVSPQTFPHIVSSDSANQKQLVTLDDSTILIERKIVYQKCDTRFNAANIKTATNLSFSIPTGTTMTWTPLDSSSFLLDQIYERPRYVIKSTDSKIGFFISSPEPATPALVEIWKDGVRVVQELVIAPPKEEVGGVGFAIEKNGDFLCTPFDDQPDVGNSLSRIVRLPPGRYPFQAGSYGVAILNLFGIGIMNIEVGGKVFWKVLKPDDNRATYHMCWELTEFGPTNMVTGAHGPGPNFRFVFEDSKIYFDEKSYTICYGGGTAVTLAPKDRL